MTETGMSLGTPHYMSPEQAMGEREITARSDVYALGAVLYEMLTGEPPFTGATAQAVVARVVTESPRPLVPQRHTIPRHVEAAALTALEKLPGRPVRHGRRVRRGAQGQDVHLHRLDGGGGRAGPASAELVAGRALPCWPSVRHWRSDRRGALGLAPAGAGAAAEPVQPRAPPQPGAAAAAGDTAARG